MAKLLKLFEGVDNSTFNNVIATLVGYCELTGLPIQYYNIKDAIKCVAPEENVDNLVNSKEFITSIYYRLQELKVKYVLPRHEDGV